VRNRKYSNAVLSVWAAGERLDYRKGVISKAKQKKLEQIKGWTWDIMTRTPEEWVNIAIKIVKEQPDGMLPSDGQLRRSKYRGIIRTMSKYPHMFAEFKQRRLKKKAEDWAIIANNISKDGVVPGPSRLRSMGLIDLYAVMKRKPHLFSHLIVQRNTRTVEEWVALAKSLALKEQNGLLPCSKKLVELGFSGLPYTMRKHTKPFRGIKQNVKRNWGHAA
jgi:hypothetical protein